MDDAVRWFKEYYGNRKNNGLKVERENCIYQRDDASDSQIASNIMSNPVTAIKKSGFFEYSTYTKEIRIQKSIAEQMTKEDVSLLTSICNQKLQAYFSGIGNH